MSEKKSDSKPREIPPELLHAEMARRSLTDFCRLMDPKYQQTPHTEAIVKALTGLETGEYRELMIELPPQHSKSYHASQRAPAWMLGRHPDRKIIAASYGQGRAEDNSREVRRLLFDKTFPFRLPAGVKQWANCEIASDSAAVEEWRTTAGGGLKAVGVGTGVTGFPTDMIILDDPVKDREEAESDTQRENTWKWFTDVLLTRYRPGSPRLFVLMMTRWHDDDLGGRLLNSKRFKDIRVLRLPALAEEGDPLGRAIGAPLWPEAFGEEYYAQQLAAMGSRSFAAIYQQNPTPAEGTVFKSDWFKTERWEKLPDNLVKVQALDTSSKIGVSNDFSAMALLGTDGVKYYLIDMWRDRVEYPVLKRIVHSRFVGSGATAVFVEDTSSAIPLLQEMRQTSSIPLIPCKLNNQGKQARAESVTPLCEAHKVVLPKHAPWLTIFEDELLRFPNGKHDDMVDAFVLGLMNLRTLAFGAAQEGPHLKGWMGR